jgi:hypothetical protein
LQITKTKLVLLTFEGAKLRDIQLPPPLSIVSVGKEYLESSDLIFVLLNNGEVRSYSAIDLSQKLV